MGWDEGGCEKVGVVVGVWRGEGGCWCRKTCGTQLRLAEGVGYLQLFGELSALDENLSVRPTVRPTSMLVVACARAHVCVFLTKTPVPE